MEHGYEGITTEYHLLRDAVQCFFQTLREIIPANTFFVAATHESAYLLISVYNASETLVKEGDTLALPVTGKLGACSFLGIPIVLRDGRTFGQFCALDRKHAFTREDARLLERMAVLVSRLIEVEENAIFDDLTGVYRRKYMEGLFYHLPTTAKKAIVFLDLDDFKSINDTYGHEVGDEVLRKIGAILKEIAVVHQSIACRYAGDEFVILLPDAGEETVLEAVDHLMDRLSRPLPIGEMALTVSASVGICLEAGSLQEYIQRADSAMYQIKRENKHGVRIYAG